MSILSFSSLGRRGSLTEPSLWRLRLRTLEAMAALAAAQGAVKALRFERWRGVLGWPGDASAAQRVEARRLAAHVERAAGRLPFATRCLPRAVALSVLLRRRTIGHRVVLAARPAPARGDDDDLHAWVEVGGTVVLGDLPGPWLEVLSLPRN